MKSIVNRGWVGAFAVLVAFAVGPSVARSQDPARQVRDCDGVDQAYRDAKLNLKEQQLGGDAEGIRLAQRDLDAARSDFCDCLRNNYLATGSKPDNYNEICWPYGVGRSKPIPRGQTGKDRQIGPVACVPELDAFERAKSALNDPLREPEPFEEDTEGPRLQKEYEDAWRKLCDCLRRFYGNRMPPDYRRLCSQLPDPAAKPTRGSPISPQPPPAQIDPASENLGTEPAPPGPGDPQAPAGQGRAPRTGNPPPPPPPPPPPSVDPNAPAPPGPGMPAPPGPGAPAADCLREGAWNLTFNVESHANNHDHQDCVRFLRRLLKAIFGGFAGDLFSAKFEDLLPEMQCTKIPGCSGSCQGTLPRFAGKDNVQFEIQDLRRNGDRITGKLVVTSGGEILFSLQFSGTPAVSA